MSGLVFWYGSWCPFYLNNHLAEVERAGCFTLIVLWLSVFLTVTWVSLQSVTASFPGHTHLLIYHTCLDKPPK